MRGFAIGRGFRFLSSLRHNAPAPRNRAINTLRDIGGH